MIGQDVHGVALPQRQQAQVAELAAGEVPVRQVIQRAQVVPAEAGEVIDVLRVADPGTEPKRQVSSQVGAGARQHEPARRQHLAVAVPTGEPGDQRGAEQRRGASLGNHVHEADALLVAVQRRPVG